MYTLLLFIALSLPPSIFVLRRKSDWSTKKRTVHAVTYTLAALDLGFIVAFATIPRLMPMHVVDYGPVRLVAMRSSDGLNGAFIWGSGSFTTRTFYHFFMRNDDGSMTPGGIEASSIVHIVEDPGLMSEGSWTTHKLEMDLSSPLANWCICHNTYAAIASQEFHVPVGTVLHNFSLQ